MVRLILSYNSASTISGFSITLISIILMIAFTVFVAVYDKMWRKDIYAPRTEDQSTNELKCNKPIHAPVEPTLC